MIDGNTNVPAATYGWFGEFVLIVVSIAAVTAIYISRPEYYSHTLALSLLVCTWYTFRTLVNYIAGNPITFHLIKLQDPSRRTARLLTTGMVVVLLSCMYLGMYLRYFNVST